MLLQGLVIMVVGVGMVIGFLSLLVFILMLSAKIIPRFNHILPDEAPRTRTSKKHASKTAAHHAADASEAAIAAVIAAVTAHQRNG